MNNIKECCVKYKIKIKRIKKTNNYIIIYSDKNNYLLKDNSKLTHLFKYFEKINYDNYLPLISDDADNYELYIYYSSIEDSEKKSYELVNVLINLHLKSLYYEEIDIDKLYAEYNDKIDSLMNYYLKLQDYIEYFLNPSIDYRIFMENISIFYRIISLSKRILDNWYSKKISKVRKCYCINKVNLNNFILSDKNYFIDYSSCDKDYLIKDFYMFYKEELFNVDIIKLFNLYRDKLNLTDEEIELFFINICIPLKIELSNDVSYNMKLIEKEINYINKTLEFVLKEYEKDKKTNE